MIPDLWTPQYYPYEGLRKQIPLVETTTFANRQPKLIPDPLNNKIAP